MTYALLPTDRDLATALRRIAGDEIAEARALFDAPALSEGERVHRLRKHVKKLRALLRLSAARFPGHKAEDRALRDAARAVSGLRDAEVLRQTLARLTAKAPPEAAAATAHLGAVLAERHRAQSETVGPAALAAFAATLAAAQKRAPGWDLRGKAFTLVEDGLATAWTTAQKYQKRSADSESLDESFHDWRKAAKDHWYHATLFTPIWPQIMGPRTEAAGDLADHLGDHHDLAVFRLEIGKLLPRSEAEPLDALAAKQQKRLEKKAQGLSSRLFAGPAAAEIDRWRLWWELWSKRR
ncbi:CHAD domain-containing protein [Frigidibacter sp. MR17.24]|uniref:CHAD domain-containing protein n=1 Tax=Frigidibacter sp. MR17.24 TaxID=3127345 RepID=UPI003012E1ED